MCEQYAAYELVASGDMDGVRMLIGKDPSLASLVMYSALRNGNFKVTDYAIDRGACDWNMGLAAAAYCNNFRYVKFFAKRKARAWNWAVMEAAKKGHLQMVKYLVSRGTRIDLGHGLYISAEFGFLEGVKFFVKKGANRKEEALKVARECGHWEVEKYLSANYFSQ